MRKITAFALCLAAVCSASAQKTAVDQAKALSGKLDKIGDARTLIQQALSNPETSNQAQTYYIAGKIEFDAFDKGFQQNAIAPGSVNPEDMGNQLLNGFQYFVAALPLDSVPDEKGKVKPKYSKDIVGKIVGHNNDFFTAGANFYELKKFYPEAYNAFLIYAQMPEMAFLGDKAPQTENANRGQAYFNAALAAYSGNEPVKSADAFRDARRMGYDDINAYIYEIACWQALAQRDSTMADVAKDRIMAVAKDGNDKFGLEQPIFLNNMVNSMVQDGKIAEALTLVSDLIASNPDNAALYGLRGFINGRADNEDASVADYKKAASLPGVDYETLKAAANKVYRVGAEKYNALDMADRAGRMQLKAEYFEPAKTIAEQAAGMQQPDSELNYIIDNINYALDTFFK